MIEEKVLKVPFAGRMDPDLKQQLTAEADKRNMTLSSYIELRLKEGKNVENEVNRRISRLEQLMASRPSSVQDDFDESEEEEYEEEDHESLMNEEEEALLDRIEEVEAENSQLQATIQNLTREKETLQEDLAAQPFRFTAESKTEMEVYLEKLGEYYPDLSREELLVASLYVTLMNKTSSAYFKVEAYEKRSREDRLSKFTNE